MTQSELVDRPRPSRANWLVPLVAVPLAAAVGLAAGQDGENIAFIMGYSIPGTLMIWGVAYYAILKPRGVRRSWRLLLTLYVVACSTGCILSIYYQRQASAARSGMLNTYQNYRAEAGPIDRTPSSVGDFGEIERLTRELTQVYAGDAAAYKTELSRLAIKDVLAPATLATPHGVERARERVAAATLVVEKYAELGEQRQAEFTAKIIALPVRESMRQEMLSGAIAGEADFGPTRRRIWANEAALLAEMAALLDHLASTRGRWAVHEGNLQFDHETDLAAFKRGLENIEALEKESMALHAEATSRNPAQPLQ